jgi:outer membrane protein assembly factor BamE (lipoprotein component of BamABCDE complex)
MAIGLNLRIAIVVAILIAGVCFAARWCLGPVVSQATLDRLRVGMTAREVEQVLGPATDTDDDSDCWYYEKPFNPGWLTVTFDDEGRMASYGQELAYP